MFANLEKREFKEWILLYLLDEMLTMDVELVGEDEQEWAAFISILNEKQMLPQLQQGQWKLSMKVRTLGKSVIDKLKLMDVEDKINIMF